jgi:hypothetical protein
VAADDATPIGFASRLTAAGSEAIVTSYTAASWSSVPYPLRRRAPRDHLVREFFCRPWSPQ